MQQKVNKVKSVQEVLDNMKKRREERKTKENRKIASSKENHDYIGRLIDKDYEKQNIEVGSILGKFVIPELVKRGLM